jgi:hypothetical protein
MTGWDIRLWQPRRFGPRNHQCSTQRQPLTSRSASARARLWPSVRVEVNETILAVMVSYIPRNQLETRQKTAIFAKFAPLFVLSVCSGAMDRSQSAEGSDPVGVAPPSLPFRYKPPARPCPPQVAPTRGRVA